jgi:hypothetical protein
MSHEVEGVETVRHGGQAEVSIPGTSGHHQPGSRADVVHASLQDEHVRDAEHIRVVVPRGDHEALLAAKDELPDSTTRSAGASVIVEGDRPPTAQVHGCD